MAVFNKRKDEELNEFDTLLGEGTIFEGNLQSEKSVRVDGKINGNITAEGNVYVGEKSEVKGNISGNDVFVSGQVDGNITAKGLLKLSATAKISGDIEIHSFVADEGGIFQGKCNMIETPKAETVNFKKNDFKKSTLVGALFEDKEKSNDM